MLRQVLIKIRRGTEAQLPVLDVGELGFCTDTNKLYIGTPNGNQLLVAAQSVGDMLKSIYDTDYDGKVDAAETADSVPWTGVTGKPSTFTPSSHKSTHAQGGSDPLSPSDIGAVNKTGDSMTGPLTVPSLIAKISIPSSSPPSAWPNGFVAGIVYQNGYPVPYGTIFSYKGTSEASCVQLLQSWPGNDGGEAYLYVRSARDVTDMFGAWRKIWGENNDGAGSGLDADLLDGKHATDFMPKGPITWNQLKGV